MGFFVAMGVGVCGVVVGKIEKYYQIWYNISRKNRGSCVYVLGF